MPKVLIVDDDPDDRLLAATIVRDAGFDPLEARTGAEAMAILQRTPGIRAVLLDLVMPEMDGMGVLEAMRRSGIAVPVIVRAGPTGTDAVLSAMRLGAVDFVAKPLCAERVAVSLRNAMTIGTLETALTAERDRRTGTLGFSRIVAGGPGMARALALAEKAAASTLPVLIEGERGAGKEMLARAIHGHGDRAGKPFVSFHCGAVPSALLETALFGEAGVCRKAHGGTLYLDEIGVLPPKLQHKLLELLETGEIGASDGARPQKVNLRLVAATSRRLLNLAVEKRFREDLYYRLNVLPIYVPPLRERPEDIRPLAVHFLTRFAAEEGRPVGAIGEKALALLIDFDWPGNVRQLQNAVYRAVVLAEGPVLEPTDFPRLLAAREGVEAARRHAAAGFLPDAPIHIDLAPAPPAVEPADAEPSLSSPFLDTSGRLVPLEAIEKDLIVFAIDHHCGRMARVARELGIGRSTLYRKLKEYGIEPGGGADVA